MHLLDIPKAKHAPRLPYLTLIAALYLAAVPWWSPRPEPGLIQCGPRHFVGPVRRVTVTTAEDVTGWQGCEGRCAILHTHQMPLMELYNELCKIELRAEQATCSRWEMKQIIAQKEKEFGQKYGLTHKQISMIKQEGYQLKLRAYKKKLAEAGKNL